MKALIQTGSSGRVPVPPEKRFLINERLEAKRAADRAINLAAKGKLPLHQKEEELLFKAMLETKDEMANNLVNHGMIVEHNLARLYVWELENALKAYQKDPTVKLKLAIVTNTMSYVYLLRRHIDKENRVAYPYGERLLSKEVIEKLNEQAQNYMK